LADYKQILALDPVNSRAREGLEKIAISFENRARSKQEIGELVESLSIVNEGLRFIPSSTRLLSLQGELMSEIKEEKRTAEQEKQKKKRNPRAIGTF
jgi:hypothetical protein